MTPYLILSCVVMAPQEDPEKRHPLLRCREILIVEIEEATERTLVGRSEARAWPEKEYRGELKLKIEEVLAGARKVGEVFPYPVIEYRISGSDRPTTPWDHMDLKPGLRFLFAPGGRLEWNKDLDGIHDIPLILQELPSKHNKRPHHKTDLEEVRLIIKMRDLPTPQQGRMFRERLLGQGFTEVGALQEMIQKNPEVGENVKSIGDLMLRKGVPNDLRRDWIWFLDYLYDDSRPWTDGNGNKQLCDIWWRILGRDEPPPGEDVRVNLSAAQDLFGVLWPDGRLQRPFKWTEPGIKPDDFIPRDCSKERILKALEYTKTNSPTKYHEGDKVLNYNPLLDPMIRYVTSANR